MRLSVLPCLAAGAGLVQVSAVPLRVIMVSESQGAGSGLRFGHPAAAAHDKSGVGHATLHVDGNVAHVRPHKAGKGCALRFKEKALSLSNAFRQALGMPLIETEGSVPSGTVKILPFMGTSPTFIEVGPNGVDGKTRGGDDIRIVTSNVVPIPSHHHHAHHAHHGHHGHHGIARIRREPFLTRVHYALLTLGPWEGRAIAFVLGCGLGVLLRMIWVLVVVSYRTIRGDKEEQEYEHVLFEQYDAEEILVPPPNYVYTDEKAPLVEEPQSVAEEAK